MARARNVKPGFFRNEKLAALSPHSRLLFIGLWTLADRDGRIEDRPKRISADVFPYEEININALLSELVSGDFIRRYCSNGVSCICINTWKKHQRPHPNEMESELPSEPIVTKSDSLVTLHDSIVAGSEPIRPLPPSLLSESLTTESPSPHPQVFVNGNGKPKTDFDPEPRFKAYANRHPGTRTRIGDCRAAYMRYVTGSTDPPHLADSLDELQEQWLEYWKNSRVAPLGLYNFLAAGDCIATPPPPIATHNHKKSIMDGL